MNWFNEPLDKLRFCSYFAWVFLTPQPAFFIALILSVGRTTCIRITGACWKHRFLYITSRDSNSVSLDEVQDSVFFNKYPRWFIWRLTFGNPCFIRTREPYCDLVTFRSLSNYFFPTCLSFLNLELGDRFKFCHFPANDLGKWLKLHLFAHLYSGSSGIFPAELPMCLWVMKNEIRYVCYKVLHNCKLVVLFPYFSSLFSWVSDLLGGQTYRRRNLNAFQVVL